MAIKKVRIYDMDGTIVSSLHRYKTILKDGKEYIDLPYWIENQHKAMEDSLLPLAKQYQEDLKNPEIYVIIATARVMGDKDWQFVKEILGEPNYFISRKAGDTQSGATMKIKGLARFFNLKNFKQATFTFFEDNTTYLKSVCDHFKINGVYIPSDQGH